MRISLTYQFILLTGDNFRSLLAVLVNRPFCDKKKERVRGKTPSGKLDQQEPVEKDEPTDAYAPFPDNTNPETGEIGGPRGPEPTRYGDWERKGRVSDF